MAMMSNDGEKKCPLCDEEMDWTDRQLKPCKCGYEICVWCWHHVMDMAEKDGTEGRCPACRAPYDKERIVGTEAKCERLDAMKDREIKPQKPKPKKLEERKDLSNVRVIQRRMAYVIGLPLSLADEDLLQRKDYFGQYGKVCKVSLSRTAGGAVQQFINDTCSVYITYSKEEEAIRCIQSVHGFVLEGRSLRASFGTAKYCHAWLKNMPCNNQACLYLHTIGADEDSFGKDEEAAVHTRNRVYQIVGAAHNMQQRSGSILPPPVDEPLNSSSIAPDKLVSHSTKRELIPNGPLTCSISSKDQDGRIKTPNRSFVDVVARSSSGPELETSTGDQKLLKTCSDFSSIAIAESYHDTEHSNGMLSKVSSICPSPREVDNGSSHYMANSFREPECYHLPLPDKESHHYAVNSFRDPSKHSVSGIADHIEEKSFLMSDSSHSNLEEDLFHYDDQVSELASTHPLRYSDSSNGYGQLCKEISGARDINADCRNVNNYVNQVSAPFGVVNSRSDSDRKTRSSNSFSDDEIVGQLRRLDGHNPTSNSDSSMLDAVESNIVSSILSLDFDSCDDSLSLPHSLAQLHGGSDGRRGSCWNSSKSDRSRFSFAKEDSYSREASNLNSSFSYNDQASKKYSLFSDYMVKDSVGEKSFYLSGPQNNGLRTSSAPPGFSVTPSSSYERTNQLYPASSGSYSVNPVSYPNNQYCATLNGHTRSASDFDFNDPAILAVHGGNLPKEMNNSGFGSWQTSTPQLTTYDEKARLWLLMQQAGSTQQGSIFAPTFVQDRPSVRQESQYSVSNGDRFSLMGNSFGVNSKMAVDQNQTYNPSYSQFSQQIYGDGPVSNGYRSSRDQILQKGELGVQEVQRNDRIGFDNYFSGRRDLMYPMPGDVYNRVYGL